MTLTSLEVEAPNSFRYTTHTANKRHNGISHKVNSPYTNAHGPRYGRNTETFRNTLVIYFMDILEMSTLTLMCMSPKTKDWSVSERKREREKERERVIKRERKRERVCVL